MQVPPPLQREGVDQIAELLDDALRGALSDVTDLPLKVRARRLRFAGVALLAAAAVCISVIGLLPHAKRAIGILVLTGCAIALLLLGGWLIDKAGKEEVCAHRCPSGGPLREILSDTSGVQSQPRVRRRRYFGMGMLALAAFCVCVVAAPLPGKQPLDAAMWVGFSITLLAVGGWQIGKAAKDALRAREMSAAAQRRESAKVARHMRRVR